MHLSAEIPSHNLFKFYFLPTSSLNPPTHCKHPWYYFADPTHQIFYLIWRETLNSNRTHSKFSYKANCPKIVHDLSICTYIKRERERDYIVILRLTKIMKFFLLIIITPHPHNLIANKVTGNKESYYVDLMVLVLGDHNQYYVIKVSYSNASFHLLGEWEVHYSCTCCCWTFSAGHCKAL